MLQTLKFWFLLYTRQFKKAEEYGHKLSEQGYGLAGGLAGWRVYRMFTRQDLQGLQAVEPFDENWEPAPQPYNAGPVLYRLPADPPYDPFLEED